MKLLSICIPTYDRQESLSSCVESIFGCKSREFEVVVIDNCSPRNPNDYLNTSDSRLRVVRREDAVDGKVNIGECLLYASGKYCMICLDQDQVDGNRLEDFLAALHSYDELYGGYCQLNVNGAGGQIVVDAVDCVRKYGYLSKHPSGDFYRTETIQKIIAEAPSELVSNPFSFDYYLAECANCGKMMYYGKPLIFMADAASRSRTKSLSYRKEDGNLYFYPLNRMDQLLSYMQHALSLQLSVREYRALYATLYSRTVKFITYEYKYYHQLPAKYLHYNIQKREVSVEEMRGYIALLNAYIDDVVPRGSWRVSVFTMARIKFELTPFFSGIKNTVKLAAKPIWQ